MEYRICPSILAADFLRLGELIPQLEKAGCRHLHLDIMDGHFVPQITFGEKMVADVRQHFRGLVDAHLMVSEPANHIAPMCRAGADLLIFHLETAVDRSGIIRQIRDFGKKAGIAIDGPSRDLGALWPLLPSLDMVLVATGKVGKAGQKIELDQFDKVRQIRQHLNGRDLDIMVDIGINGETISLAKDAGANWFVVGSALFNQADIAAAFGKMQNMIS
jgi:ribulose-phosphate 3-epimerase